MRPDYCPIGNEPCQSLCDTPCSTQQRYTTDAMKVRQAVAQALAQSKQDCVGWFGYDTGLRLWFEANKGDDGAIPLYKARSNT